METFKYYGVFGEVTRTGNFCHGIASFDVEKIDDDGEVKVFTPYGFNYGDDMYGTADIRKHKIDHTVVNKFGDSFYAVKVG